MGAILFIKEFPTVAHEIFAQTAEIVGAAPSDLLSPANVMLVSVVLTAVAAFGGMVVQWLRDAAASRAAVKNELFQMNALLRSEMEKLMVRIDALEKESEAKSHTIHILEWKMAIIRKVVFEKFSFDIDSITEPVKI